MQNRIATISVYYSREYWYILIKKCIIPLIQEFSLNREDSDINLLFKLNGDDDTNCQLIVYGISEKLEERVIDIQNRLNDFVSKYLSSESTSYGFKPGHVLWMPFPNNSVKVNYSSAESFFATPRWFLFYKQSLTNLLSTVFIDSDDDFIFNNDDLFSFVLFIQCFLLKVIMLRNFDVNISLVFEHIESRLKISSSEKLYSNIVGTSTKDYINNIEIIRSNFDSDFTENKTFCQHLNMLIFMFANNNGSLSVNSYYVAKLMMIAYDHLGINDAKALYIQNMIKLFYPSNTQELAIKN